MSGKLYKSFMSLCVLSIAGTIFAQETCNAIDVMTSPSKKFSTLAGSQYCATTAKIVWKDGENNGTRRIDYGTSTNYGQSVTLTGSSGTATMSGLTPNTIYYWRVYRYYQGKTIATPAGSFTTTGGAVVQPPVITSAAAATCTTGVAKTYTATATDPAGKTVTFTYSNLPAWMSASGAVLTMNATSAGNATVRIIASNGSASDTLDLAVTAVAKPAVQPPLLTSAAAVTCTTGATKSYTATATDPAGKTVTFSYGTLPSWITSSGATLTMKPTAAGNTNVKIFASNGSAYDTLDLAVTVIQSTGINSNITKFNKELSIKIGKTAISFPFNNENTFTLSIISLNGSLISKKVISVNNSELKFNFNKSGTFICKVESKSGAVWKRIVLHNLFMF